MIANLTIPPNPRQAERRPRHVFADKDAPGLSHYPGLGDVNGDGLMDFIATRGHGKGVLWFEAPDFTLHEINPDLTGPHDLAVGDIDPRRRY